MGEKQAKRSPRCTPTRIINILYIYSVWRAEHRAQSAEARAHTVYTQYPQTRPQGIAPGSEKTRKRKLFSIRSMCRAIRAAPSVGPARICAAPHCAPPDREILRLCVWQVPRRGAQTGPQGMLLGPSRFRAGAWPERTPPRFRGGCPDRVSVV